MGRLAAGLGLVFAAVIVLHTVGLGTAAARFRELFDVGHVLGFAGVAVITGRAVLGARWSTSDRLKIAFACCIVAALALIAEAAQVPTARDASVADLLRDALGIAAGSGLLLASRSKALPRAMLIACATVLLGIGLAGPGRMLVARGLAAARVPVLITFDGFPETPFVRGVGAEVQRVAAPAGWPVEGEAGRVVPDGSGRYAGISFVELPGNWAQFQSLEFLVAAESSALGELTIRIHDRAHNGDYADRFNRSFDVGVEVRRVRIDLDEIRSAPRSRSLDLSRVAEIVVFSSAPERGAFLIDDLRLR